MFSKSVARFCFTSLLCITYPSLAAAQDSTFDTTAIEAATGLKGTYNDKENVFKVSMPRSDLKVVVDQLPMPPFMGLTSYAAFTKGSGSDTVVMGDTVLLEDEVNPVMSVALDSGLEVTALHNHFFYDQPHVYFMHVGGHGDASRLGAAVKRMYDKVKEIRASATRAATTFGGQRVAQPSQITAAPLDKIFGVRGESNSGMYKAVLGRTGRMHGMEFGKEMGLNTWAAFAGTDDNAVVDGDFAMTEDELQMVLKSMREHGINIVAIHHHMTHEEPRYVFLHYWGKGRAAELASAVQVSMDLQGEHSRSAAPHATKR